MIKCQHIVLLVIFLLGISCCCSGETEPSTRDLTIFSKRNRKARRKRQKAKRKRKKAQRKQELQQQQQQEGILNTSCNQGSCTAPWNNAATCDVTCEASQVKVYERMGNDNCVTCEDCPAYDATCPESSPKPDSPCSQEEKRCEYCGDCCGEAISTHGCKCVEKDDGYYEWKCWEAICLPCS